MVDLRQTPGCHTSYLQRTRNWQTASKQASKQASPHWPIRDEQIHIKHDATPERVHVCQMLIELGRRSRSEMSDDKGQGAPRIER